MSLPLFYVVALVLKGLVIARMGSIGVGQLTTLLVLIPLFSFMCVKIRQLFRLNDSATRLRTPRR